MILTPEKTALDRIILLHRNRLAGEANIGRLHQALKKYVREYGVPGIRTIMDSLFMRVGRDDFILREVVQFLGRSQQLDTMEERFRVLVVALAHESPYVRDAAAKGLMRLGKEQAVKHIEWAMELEGIDFVREQFLESLIKLRK